MKLIWPAKLVKLVTAPVEYDERITLPLVTLPAKPPTILLPEVLPVAYVFVICAPVEPINPPTLVIPLTDPSA